MPKRKRTLDHKEREEDNEERYFLNQESVSQHLYCSICQDVFHDPQRAPCGHSFCRKCIEPWLKQSRTCPEDRKPVQPKDLHHDFILENIIGDQMVACPFRRKGCVFIGQLALLSSHKKNCEYNPNNLPEFLQVQTCESPQVSTAGSVFHDSSNLYPDEEESLPTPGKPSLKMRLFTAGGGKKQMLYSMFDKKDNIPK